MDDQLRPEEELSEIQRLLVEAKADLPGAGGFIAVWAILTSLALVACSFEAWLERISTAGIWAIHNLLGWSYTLYWSHRIAQQTGRSFFRLRTLLRIWAMVTFAIWLASFAVYAAITHQVNPMPFLVAMCIGIGITASGLLFESRFSQWLGVVLTGVAGSVVIIQHDVQGNRIIWWLIVTVLFAWLAGVCFWKKAP